MNKKIKAIQLENKDIKSIYTILHPAYERLWIWISESIKTFMLEKEVHYLSVDYRVKTFMSFLEKSKRKNYNNPFEQTEDFCWIRIICFFQADVKSIIKIIEEEFDIVDTFDKTDFLSLNQFWYRSRHFIVKIKKGWTEAPNFRGLEDLKCEIQLRTILMHAWAEIEHKLAYKKKEHIPPEFRRKFSRISAKLEEADEQFEELMKEITEYRESKTIPSDEAGNFDENLKMNLENLQALLDSYFPKRKRSIKHTRELLDEFLKFKISIKDLIESYHKLKKYHPNIEEDMLWIDTFFEQTWIIRNMLWVSNNMYFKTKWVKLNNSIINWQKWNK